MTADSTSLASGFVALHGNRTELLLETVAEWLKSHALAPLEPEIILVQSNGMAEWVKMALARHSGISAAVSVQLPARFLWQTYRQVLGRDALPARSPMDKNTVVWRLMRLLPQLLDQPDFAPLAAWLATANPQATAGPAALPSFQLARAIADLFDQYQVHRPDWLKDWAEGDAQLKDGRGKTTQLPEGQRWQARLWQALVAELDEAQRALVRPQVHEDAVEALRAIGRGEQSPASALPRRVVVFGMSHLPLPTLELLAALSGHSQVMMAVPNPCRFHWADIIDGREWLRSERRRLPLRKDVPLETVALEEMHLHGHPLLAAWGRQARDFVRQLDAFDESEQHKERFGLERIDLFDDNSDEHSPPNASLLAQVQQHICDLLPLAEHPHPVVAADDRSIVFHMAHSRVRELEILHDALLDLLAAPPGGKALHPRDIVVMVPQIDDFAPAIRAVFGQYGRHDPRHIPFDIADLSARGGNALVNALQWLLRLPQERCQLSELCALLEVPAIAARFGLDETDLPRLTQWMSEAGMRWGLDAAHRAGLGLDACGEQNSVLFGLRRMLMGYALGFGATVQPPFAGIEAYGEVGGLEAELAGACARLIDVLLDWQLQCESAATPLQWAGRLRSLLAAMTQASSEAEAQTLAALFSALETWVQACDDAGFDGELTLPMAAEAWMDALAEPNLNRRFRAGGVTFCTLMPMRAIPFEVVCLLGMNDGDYPRRSPRSDFDLMALPGQQRPGDRVRRDDDRQLMLEAILSARRVLHVSWCGRSVRDNSEQPPSVLVAQLRDYLAAGWSPQVVAERTTEHPLQPFSRRYFEADSTLRTWAGEWRAAHEAGPADAANGQAVPHFRPDPARPLTVAALANFLRHPVKTFFRQRLGVVFEEAAEALPDEESFGPDGLEHYSLIEEISAAALAELALMAPQDLRAANLDQAIERPLQRIRRAGRLPLGVPGDQLYDALQDTVLPMIEAWRRERCAHPHPLPRVALRFEAGDAVLEDWLDGCFSDGRDDRDEADERFLEVSASKVIAAQSKNGITLRPHTLLRPWLRCLLATACGEVAAGVLVYRDATVFVAADTSDEADERAKATLTELLHVWQQGMHEALPLAVKTAIAWLRADKEAEAKAATAYDGDPPNKVYGEVSEPCLARAYSDFASLSADGRFETLAETVYQPLLTWIDECTEAKAHNDNEEAA